MKEGGCPVVIQSCSSHTIIVTTAYTKHCFVSFDVFTSLFVIRAEIPGPYKGGAVCWVYSCRVSSPQTVQQNKTVYMIVARKRVPDLAGLLLLLPTARCSPHLGNSSSLSCHPWKHPQTPLERYCVNLLYNSQHNRAVNQDQLTYTRNSGLIYSPYITSKQRKRSRAWLGHFSGDSSLFPLEKDLFYCKGDRQSHMGKAFSISVTMWLVILLNGQFYTAVPIQQGAMNPQAQYLVLWQRNTLYA